MSTGVKGRSASRYQGEDRRRLGQPLGSPFGRLYTSAVFVIAGVWTLITFGWHVAAPGEAVALAQLQGLLQVASAVIAAAIGAMAVARWRLTGDTPALLVGLATLTFAVVRLGVVELLPRVAPEGFSVEAASWLRPAVMVVVVALLGRAAFALPVDTGQSPWRLAGISLAALLLVTASLQLVPWLASAIDGAASGGSGGTRSYRSVNMLGLVTFAWLALALLYTWKGRRLSRWLFTWYGLLLICLTLGEFSRVYSPPPTIEGLLDRELMHLLGLLLALNGTTREILYAFADTSVRLARSEYRARTATEQIRDEQLAAEERAHEARSALAAIEGATRTLQNYRDRLPAETQTALTSAVSGEIRRLQRLVSSDGQASDTAAFSLAEALGPVLATERARGTAVTANVPTDLQVLGRAGWTEQVVQTLLDNARRYAEGGGVTVRAERSGDTVVLRIEDRGPGVAANLREAIFRRGVRGSGTVPGSGLGLYVASGLMHDQSGRLWVDEREGGGSSFALALPCAATTS